MSKHIGKDSIVESHYYCHKSRGGPTLLGGNPLTLLVQHDQETCTMIWLATKTQT